MGELKPEPQQLGTTLTQEQLLRLLHASPRQLKAWERKGWIRPLPSTTGASPNPESAPSYTFADAAALRAIVGLRRSGVPERQLRQLQDAIQTGSQSSPMSHAWNDLQVEKHGRRLSIRFQGARMEPITGQWLLDFSPQQESQKLRSLGSLKRGRALGEAERRARSDRLFLAGLRFEEHPETIPKAIRAYEKATHLNPHALGAFINLGTIHYHQGDLQQAEASYRAALRLSPGSALVHFNLGNLLEEQGKLEEARAHYEEAVRLDPAYPDPRFNLALVFEKLGRHGKASQQWRAYLKLDSESRWAAYARQQLEQVPLRLVPQPRSSPETPANGH